MTNPWTIAAVLPAIDETGVGIQHAMNVANQMSARLVLLQLSDLHPNIERCGPAGICGTAVNPGTYQAIEHVVLPGPAAISIPRYADSIAADLILVAAEPLRRWDRFRKPFVLDDVVRSMSRPVWLTGVAPEADTQFRCRRVVCVVTLHPSDDSAIKHAVSLASRTGAELILLHVLPHLPDGLLWWRTSIDRPTQASVAGERIRELATQVGAVSSSIVTTGSVHRSVANFVADVSADVVVMPHSDGAAPKQQLLSPAAALRSFSCPVALVPVTPAHAPALVREDHVLCASSLL